jgi:predicted CXXCH cytochrome family protein
MKVWTAVAGISVVAVLVTGCDATSRYRVLSLFFDGVPPPTVAGEAEDRQAAASASGVQARRVGVREHGPYAAKLCGACHQSAAANSFVAPREQLCVRCHELKLDKPHVHGPLASGGCMTCHDPHSSQYRSLLVSEFDGFCFRCHDRDAVASVAVHAGMEAECTSCHDPHASDQQFLLR